MTYSILSCTPGWDPSGTGLTVKDATAIAALQTGDTILVWTPYKNSGTAVAVSVTVTDSLGNTYTEDAGQAYFPASSNNNGGRFFKCVVTVAGTPTFIRATAGATVTNFGCIPTIIRGATGTPFQTSAAPKRQASVGTGTDALVSNSMTCVTPPIAILGFSHDFVASNGVRANVGTGFTSIFKGQKSNSLADIVTTEHKRATSTGSYQATFTMSQSGDDLEVIAYMITEANTAPLIVSTSSASPANGSNLTITGQNFGASQGGSPITIGGVTPTVVSWGDTSIVATVDRGTNKYGVSVNISVTVGGQNTTYAITLSPQSGWGYVNIGTPNVTAANRITAVSDIASGDQLAYDNKSSTVTVFTDATFEVGPAVTSFGVEDNDGTGWGAVGTQTINPSLGLTIMMRRWKRGAILKE